MATNYVIIGSGVAGFAAAEALRARAPEATVTMVSEEPAGFYSRPGLAYYLSGLIPEQQLMLHTPAALRALGLTWVQGRAVSIDPIAHRLQLADGHTLPYDRLLLATGARAAAPDFPGGDLNGVVLLDTLDDARRMVRQVRRGMPVVVVGGGITALELAEGLHARGAHVHYLLRGARYWANVLDAEESQIVENRLQANGVQLHYHTTIAQAIGAKGRLSAVETTAGERIPCQLLAVAIGTRPRLDLAKTAGLAVERGVLTDAYLRTSAPDIFAAGDVAQVADPRTGKATLDTLWSTARAHGTTVAATLSGTPTVYQRAAAMNVTLLAGIPTTLIGALGSGSDADLVAIARGDSETWHTDMPSWVVVERHDINRIRLMLGERTMNGALVMGDQTLSHPLQCLISAQVDITPIRAALQAHPNTLVPLITDFFVAWEQSYAPDRSSPDAAPVPTAPAHDL